MSSYQEKRTHFGSLAERYNNNGTVHWSEFSADPITNAEKVVLVSQSDFTYGTLRVQQPCLLKLTQSIRFNPNRPTSWLDGEGKVTNDPVKARKLDPNRCLDWFPKKGGIKQDQYFQPEVSFAYGLGFFSAIALEATGVIVDLNGYTLEQHPEHLLQQRFYAQIELADQPFIPFQGPSNFGAVLRSAHGVMIHNGKLGASSHHGIHGNNNTNVLLENLTINNFEVAGVALNGSRNVTIKNVNVSNNSQKVPVLATYSAARFSKLFSGKVVEAGLSNPFFTNALGLLNQDLDQTFNSVIFNNGTVPPLFQNPSGLIDGAPYGIVINPTGVAVNGFLPTRKTMKANETGDLVIIDTNVNQIRARVNEVVAIGRATPGVEGLAKGIVVDTAGAVLQVFNGISKVEGNKYHYQGTSLSNVQMELAKIKLANPKAPIFGTLSIDRPLTLWAGNSKMWLEHNGDNLLTLKNADGSDHLEVGQRVQYIVAGSGDSMFHVTKPVMGIRIDGSNGFVFDNVSINNIENSGLEGTNLAGQYI